MVLVGILNGYYRSGTTIWMRIIDESNPNIAVLSEPTSPVVVRQIENKGFNGIEPLHGWNIFRGYGKLSKKTFYEYCKRWEEVFGKYEVTRGIMTSWDDVKYLLEPFIECDEKVFIKSTQLHFFLHRIENELGVPCIHIKRNLADNIAGHLAPDVLANKIKAIEVLSSKERDSMFFVDSVYRNITELLNYDPGLERVLFKLIFNIRNCNNFVESRNMTIVKFEEPNNVANQIIRKFGIHIHRHKLMLFDYSKVHIAPQWLKDEVRYAEFSLILPLLDSKKNFNRIP